MENILDIHKDFEGYNAYPIKEAEKIVRSRIAERLSSLVTKVHECVEKAKNEGRIKELSEILTVYRRMERLKKEIDDRDMVFVPAYLKERITKVDDEKLRSIDLRVAEIINAIDETIEQISCDKTDMYVVKKFVAIETYIHEMEQKCHERAHALKKDSL